MTLFEGVVLFNLAILLFVLYNLHKVSQDIRVLFMGMAGILTDLEEYDNDQDLDDEMYH